MFYNKCVSRFSIILCIVFLFTAPLLIAMDSEPEVASVDAKAEELSPNVALSAIFDALNNGSATNEFSNILNLLVTRRMEESLRKQAELRNATFKRLPEHLQAALNEVNTTYEHFSKIIKVKNLVLNFCTDAQRIIRLSEQGNEELSQSLLENLDKLQESLTNGSFSQVFLPQQLDGGMFNIQNFALQLLQATMQVNAEKRFSREDMHITLQQLATFIDEHAHESALDYTIIASLHKLLHVINKYDGKNIVNECVVFWEPELESLSKVLHEAHSLLANDYVQLSADADPLLIEAFDLWLDQLKTYIQTVKALRALIDTAAVDLAPLLRLTSQAYDVAWAFFEAHYFDVAGEGSRQAIENNPVVWCDGLLRAAITMAGYMHRKSDVAAQELGHYMLGSESLSDFIKKTKERAQSKDDWAYVIGMSASSLQLFFNPTVFADRMHPIKRSLLRIAGSIYWYYLLDRNTGLAREEGMRIAAVATIREAQRFIDGRVQIALHQYADPILMEQIENLTMGLIKPELIDLFFEVAVPMLFLQRIPGMEQIIDLRTHDFLRFDVWFTWHLRESLGRPLRLTDFDNNKKFYVEYKLVHYAGKSLGSFWGGIVANQFREPVKKLLTGVLECAGVVTSDILHLLGGGLDDVGDVLDIGLNPENRDLFYKRNYEVMRSLFASIFNEKSEEREMVIGFLKSRGLFPHHINNPFEENYYIIMLIIQNFAQLRLISHSQAAELLQIYPEYQKNIEFYLDVLFKQIQDNTVTAAGSFAGGAIGTYCANKILKKYFSAVDILHA